MDQYKIASYIYILIIQWKCAHIIVSQFKHEEINYSFVQSIELLF